MTQSAYKTKSLHVHVTKYIQQWAVSNYLHNGSSTATRELTNKTSRRRREMPVTAESKPVPEY